MSHQVVFLERDSIKATVRRPAFDHQWTEYASTTPDQVVERLQGASIALINKTQLREATLAQLPDLKMIAVAATGYDCVDVPWCRAHGIAVANIRGYAIHTVPEHSFALILALRRNIMAYRQDVEAGRWQTFDQVLAQADVLSLHCPLTPATRDLIGIEQFRQMKRNALLINTARGGLVNEAALMQALQEGLIAGAGFDVLTTEPPRNGHPLLDLRLPNFILTPHVAWASNEAMQFLGDQLIDNVEAWQAGTPQRLVT